jgi:hypothetical protein
MLSSGAEAFWPERSGFSREQSCFANLFLHTGGQDAFIRCMTQIYYEALKSISGEGPREKTWTKRSRGKRPVPG